MNSLEGMVFCSYFSGKHHQFTFLSSWWYWIVSQCVTPILEWLTVKLSVPKNPKKSSISLCLMKSVTFQNTDSAERDKWMGWDGDLARRFFGNLSNVWAISGKPGLCSELCNQQCIKMSLTSLLAARFARLGFIPVPTCQMIDSGGWCLHGHSPVRSSYHTVPNAYTSLDLNIKDFAFIKDNTGLNININGNSTIII